MADVASMTLTGDDRLIEIFAKAGRGAGAALVQATMQSAYDIFEDSQMVVPVDTGALRASGQVRPPEVSGTNVEVVIGYGGPAADYAIYVHEDLEANHAPGTSAKFLEVPVLNRLPEWQDEIVHRVKELLS
jgi:hypothetical protein